MSNVVEKPGIPEPPDIGARLKQLRSEQGWSLAKLAAATGISDATLSRVETGKTLVSAHNLYVLAQVLGVDITAFYSHAAHPLQSGIRSVSRAGQGRDLQTDRFLTTILASDLSKKQMHPAINVVSRDRFGPDDTLSGHPGEEFLYVLEGQLVLHSAHYAPLLLDAGDSIYFDGTMPHAYLAGEGGMARILVLTTTADAVSP
ncbi:XRE family transcriptional regulator [Tateyamaria omphalii]|uniref:helix-turn-helix domain-containing protein n=1 Tax=Tateyamaria omphalii TaxID=299262 RepID=UPI001C993E73|nr:XRE family transcriptional regulator [Tateyamaria omphalii]MBY5932708.1 XRE family transcriptional regulator [Tateyamaria omphalii]